jgi:hypothetical protein
MEHSFFIQLEYLETGRYRHYIDKRENTTTCLLKPCIPLPWCSLAPGVKSNFVSMSTCRCSVHHPVESRSTWGVHWQHHCNAREFGHAHRSNSIHCNSNDCLEVISSSASLVLREKCLAVSSRMGQNLERLIANEGNVALHEVLYEPVIVLISVGPLYNTALEEPYHGCFVKTYSAPGT